VREKGRKNIELVKGKGERAKYRETAVERDKVTVGSDEERSVEHSWKTNKTHERHGQRRARSWGVLGVLGVLGE